MLKSVRAKSLEANPPLLSDATKIILTKAAITLVALASLAAVIYGGFSLGTHTFTIFNETASWALVGAGSVILLTLFIGTVYLYRSAKDDLSKTKAPKTASEPKPTASASTKEALPQALSQKPSTPPSAAARADDLSLQPAAEANLALNPKQLLSPPLAFAAPPQLDDVATFPESETVLNIWWTLEPNEYCLAYDHIGGYTLYTCDTILYYSKKDKPPFKKSDELLFEGIEQLTLAQLFDDPRFTLEQVNLETLQERLSPVCDRIYDECMASPVYKTDKTAKKSFTALQVKEFTIYRFVRDDGVTETKIRYRVPENKGKKWSASYEGDDQEASIKSHIRDLLLKGFTELDHSAKS